MKFSKKMKKILVVLCSLVLVVTSITVSNLTTKADGGEPSETKTLTAAEIKAKIGTEANIALYKKVTASTAEDLVGNICDGWIATYWRGESTNGDDYVEINLGAVKKIDNVVIVWGVIPSKYEIQVSTDGKNYTSVKEATGDDGEETTDPDYGFVNDISVDLTFDAVEAQYVRVQCTEGTKRCFIYEMGVFEAESEETTPAETTPAETTSEETTPVETTPAETTKKDAIAVNDTTAVGTNVTATAKVNEGTTTAKSTTKVLGITTVKKASKKKTAKKLKLSFKKVTGAKKYQVQISTTNKFKKILVKKTVKKVNVTINSKKIKNKKKLYVRVKAVGAKKWSKVKKVKIKK